MIKSRTVLVGGLATALLLVVALPGCKKKEDAAPEAPAASAAAPPAAQPKAAEPKAAEPKPAAAGAELSDDAVNALAPTSVPKSAGDSYEWRPGGPQASAGTFYLVHKPAPANVSSRDAAIFIDVDDDIEQVKDGSRRSYTNKVQGYPVDRIKDKMLRAQVGRITIQIDVGDKADPAMIKDTFLEEVLSVMPLDGMSRL